jgi:hypothetical protein
MLVRFRRPAWAHMVVIVADAAFASKANVQLIRQCGYSFVIAFAMTWRFANGQSLKELVTHLPKQFCRRCWVPLEESDKRNFTWQIAQAQPERPVEQCLREAPQQCEAA